MTPRSLLITGVSGYIGGTVLSSILKTQDQWTEQLKISALVRTKFQATTVQNLGVLPVMFSSFDETEVLEKIAGKFDIIIHAGAGWHTSSAKALITGQGARRAALNRPVHYIQISGTSNLSDRPHTDGYTGTHQFNDEEDIFSYEKYRESREAYCQRMTDITVIETGEALGATTYVVMAPTIYGEGSGPFNRYSIQLPAMIAEAIKSGVHSCMDSQIPSGRKGIYFCETGKHSHRKLLERLVKAAYELGVLLTAEVKSITLQEVGDKLALGSILRAELSFGANADWETTFHTEVKAFVKKPPRERDLPQFLKKD
ncbi:NAD dependent epimerase/dehydratase family protein [Penicillium malachiteum]|uniref:NAD dependent epimerase/dehydratase family protein n=1 Tax=Penicillium malachiteum TaxID=1324776 RepID=A0AAD6HQS8_9EURO|nr:NAD dependent epimerase/dehydratase family protein [Penicillium malachiteum]